MHKRLRETVLAKKYVLLSIFQATIFLRDSICLLPVLSYLFFRYHVLNWKTLEEKSLPYLKIDKNYRLHYQLIEGDRNKPYLVYLHEGLGCVAMWSDFPELLCRIRVVPAWCMIVWDTENLLLCIYAYNSLSAQVCPQELPRLLENIIPGKPYILIGHSDGGSISLISGAERPSYSERNYN